MAQPKTRSIIRELIKTEELVNRAQDAVLGDNPKPLTAVEMGIIKMLLNKCLPDVKAIEHSGNIDSDVTKTHKVSFK